MRHVRVRGGHQRGPCSADIRRRCRQRLVRETECLGGGGRGGDTGSFDRACLVELLPRTVDRGLGPLDLRDVAFVGLHQVRERSELLTVPVERGDSGEFGLACRTGLVRLANDGLRRGDPGAGVPRGRDRRGDVGFGRKGPRDLGQRRHAGDRRRRVPFGGIPLLLQALDLWTGRFQCMQPFARPFCRRPCLIEVLARLNDPLALFAK